MSDIKDAVWECFDNNGINFDNGDPVSAAADITQYIEQQLQQAHRAAEESAKDAHRRGWDQAKREAEKACRNRAAEYWDHEAGALEVAAAIRKLEV